MKKFPEVEVKQVGHKEELTPSGMEPGGQKRYYGYLK